MNHSFAPSITTDFDQAIKYEWLETNGLGGYASSTLTCTNTRRYHGILVASLKPPVERVVLLSKLDERIVQKNQVYQLGMNEYQGGILDPKGNMYLQNFQRNLFPEFTYQVNFIRLKKSILALHGENSTLIRYEVLAADQPFTLELVPLLGPRDFHSLNTDKVFPEIPNTHTKGSLKLELEAGYPTLYIHATDSEFIAAPDWYKHFEYRVEMERGQDALENLYNPGYFARELKEGDILDVLVSTHNPQKRDIGELYEREYKRRKKIVNFDTTGDLFVKKLLLAADQFLVQRGNKGMSIMAGYHWFSDWGRDTMISLPGLCLTTGKLEIARSIIRVFAEHVSEGMIPNRFSDYDEQPKYNNADATLWFFVAVYQYLQASNDWEFVLGEILPVFKEILWWHDHGTRYQIHTEEDGLLYAGEQGVQVSWMDAKVGDWVVTPRIGKAVEINALWYNAWKIYGILLGGSGDECQAQEAFDRANAIRKSFFETFWNPDKNCLYDYVNGDYKDPAVRPNQLFAISLPFMLLDMNQARKVLRIVEDKLYTRVGLRSLAPDDPMYLHKYQGNQYKRDAAYHQGVVWSWLLGPFVDALVKVKGEKGRKQAFTVVENMKSHMGDAGMGSLSEIFEGEAPFAPKGCIAQAWSIAELLRVIHAYSLYKEPPMGLVPMEKKKAILTERTVTKSRISG
ncbi:MAG: amylo-alpha-1,6-glucosidase [Bacteroidota bacterium]